MADLFDVPFEEPDEPDEPRAAAPRRAVRRIFTVSQLTAAIRQLGRSAGRV